MTETHTERLDSFFTAYFADEDGAWREPERVLFDAFLYEHRIVFAQAMDDLEALLAGPEPLLPPLHDWTLLTFDRSEANCREWCGRVLAAGRRFLKEIPPRIDEPVAADDLLCESGES